MNLIFVSADFCMRIVSVFGAMIDSKNEVEHSLAPKLRRNILDLNRHDAPVLEITIVENIETDPFGVAILAACNRNIRQWNRVHAKFICRIIPN